MRARWSLLVLIALALSRSAGAGEVPFAAKASIATPDAPAASIPADMDGDGDLDLLYFSRGTGAEIAWAENTAGDASAWPTTHNVVSLGGTIAYHIITPADIDGDGDLDVVHAGEMNVVWYANQNGLGTSWSGGTSIVAGPANLPLAVDFDRDGDLDVGANTISGLLWMRNATGGGTSWSGGAGILASILNFTALTATDLDGDGDPDVVGGEGDNVVWFQNTAGDGSAWAAAATISSAATGVRGIAVADLDRDGDPDVVAVANGDDELAWYENTAGNASTWSAEKPIASGLADPESVAVEDVDQDGDPDVATGSANALKWFENSNGDASSWSAAKTISGGSDGADAVAITDLDGDGDLDVVYADEGDDAVAWYENLTIHRSAVFAPASEITDAADSAASVRAADLDRDGDLDVLTAAAFGSEIAWHVNDGAGGFGPKQIISTAVSTPRAAIAADLDGDGDLDVVSASYLDNKVAWYENTDGAGSFGTQQIITTAADGVASVFAADLDRDGDVDLLSAWYLGSPSRIAWHENDGTGSFAPPQTVSISANFQVFAADLDGDGDPDVIASNRTSHQIFWYENRLYAQGDFGLAHEITADADAVLSIYAADLDGDGDFDLLSASSEDDKIAWYENTDGAGSFGAQQVLTSAADGAQAVFAADLDGDGDLDVLAASAVDDRVFWFENDGAGGFGPAQGFASPDGPSSVFAADLDRDGRLDALSASVGDDRVAWYRNRGGQFALPTTDTAYLGLADGGRKDVFAIDNFHRGRTGDGDLELTTLELRFTEDGAIPMSSSGADDLLALLEIWRDDGDGGFEDGGGDTFVTAVSSFSLDGNGAQTLSFTDADPNVQLSQATGAASYFVVIELEPTASSLTPPLDRFALTHVTDSSSTAEDRDNDLPLSLEFSANTTTPVIRALNAAGDADSDGLSNGAETFTHGTDALNPDTDGDTLTDGDEVNTHGSSPLDVDSDDDTLDDATEVALGSNPSNDDTDGDLELDPDDNCILIGNAGQENNDAAPQGDACQCGDIDTGGGSAGVIDAADVLAARRHLVDRTQAPFDLTRCNVVGAESAIPDGSDCDVADIAVLERISAVLSTSVGNACSAFRP